MSANPIYHLKDSYFFEVPKGMWRRDWKTLEEVPSEYRAWNPEVHDVREFNEGLSGKIIIPQPFGTLESLYTAKSGFCISKYMILELVVAAVMLLMFSWLAKRIASGAPAKGRFANMLEAMLLFVRDQIARPAIDDPHAHDHADDHGHGHGHDHGHGHAAAHHAHAAPAHAGDAYVPFLWTLFFFILGCNLLGLVPWAGSPTAHIMVTLALAITTFLVGIFGGFRSLGPIGYLKNYIPAIDMPGYLFPLKILIQALLFVIEIISLLIKHLILAIRLLANMVAGHLVLLGIMGLIPLAAGLSFGTWSTVTGISVVGSTLFSVLELFVAFLQAYLFTFLSALFIGSSVHSHH